nr:AP2/ERF and B3 domain-containing transcription factor At1g50680-like [Tanacetum cinerariifolium]
MVERNYGEHLIRRFTKRGNEPDLRDVKIASLKQRIEELEFPQFSRTHRQKRQKLSLTSRTMGQRTSILLANETLGDEEEEYPFVNKYLSFQEELIVLVEVESCPVYDIDNNKEESMRVYDTYIEDVIEEEEGFVRKGGYNTPIFRTTGFGGEEENIEDIVVVANDLCSSMIQNILSVDFEEDINIKSYELMSFGKKYYYQVVGLDQKVRETVWPRGGHEPVVLCAAINGSGHVRPVHCNWWAAKEMCHAIVMRVSDVLLVVRIRYAFIIKSFQPHQSCELMEEISYSNQGRNQNIKSQGTKPEHKVTRLLFENKLTPSDVGKLNRLVIAKKFVVAYFPPVPDNDHSEGFVNDEVILPFYDVDNKLWKFRYCYWKSSKSFVFTRGWNQFVKEKTNG